MEQFDPKALVALVDQALGVVERDPVRIPLALFEGRLLERLAGVLEERCTPTKTQDILTSLRDELTLNPARADVADLHRAVLACRRCPRLSSPPRLPSGNLIDPDLLVVVEALPADGRLVEDLGGVGIGKGRLATTSATRCDGEPGTEERNRCAEFLYPEVEALRPSLILAVGAVAAGAFLGHGVKMSDVRGRLQWVGPWPVLPIWAPGYAARGGAATEEYAADLNVAARFIGGQ